MAEKFSQVKKITALKGHLTRVINNIRNALATEDADKDVILEMQESLCDRRDVLVSEIFTYLEFLDEQGEEEQKKLKENEIKIIDEKVDEVSREITEFLKGLRLEKGHKTVYCSDSETYIERLALPKFSGKDYFQWRILFNSLIDSKNWPNQTKMIRLLSCVEGEARELIKNFPPTDQAYQESLLLLEEIYGGARRRSAQVLRQVRQGRTICEEDHFGILRFTSTLQAARVTLGDDSEEITTPGALYDNALDRLAASLLRNYKAWIMDNEKCECLNTLISFLSRWSRIIETTNIDTNSRKHRPTSFCTNIQPLNSEKDNCVKRNDNFIPKCLWHFKVKSINERHYLDRCAEFKNLPVNKRRDFIFQNKLCKICFKPNHMARTCRNLRALCKFCKSSNDKHHFLLHERKEKQNLEEIIPTSEVLENNNCHTTKAISLQTIPVFVQNGDRKVKINALLDTGSSCSFISKEIVNHLGLKEFDSEVKSINVMHANDQPIKVSKVKLQLVSVDGRWSRTEIMYSVSNILQRSKPVVWEECKDRWPHLRSIVFPSLAQRDHHEMLIGSDLIYYHRCLKEVSGRRSEPIAKLSPLGWSCIGPVGKQNEIPDLACCWLESNLEDEICKLWKLDVLGIESPLTEVRGLTNDEKAAEDLLKEKLVYVDGMYQAPILWRDDVPQKNNYETVARRTKGMEERLRRNSLFERYDEIITTHVKKGYVIIVPESEKRDGFFLNHFPVIREERETTKIRIVFDCSQKVDGKSLNDRIYAGPKLQNDIVDITVRFRRFKYAVLADLSEMFLKIGLLPEDRKYCRFCWRGKIYEWTRTLFGRRDSPYIALFVLKESLLKYKERFPQLVSDLLRSIYVDDLAMTFETKKEVRDLVSQATEIFGEAGMLVHKWNTNCKEILDTIPEDLRAKSIVDILEGDQPTTKVLGLSWESENDVLRYTVKLEKIDENSKCTKRQILRTLSRVYDPNGLISPFLIRAKIIFQKVWMEGKDWDEPVSQKLKSEWLSWYNEVESLKEISIPRHLGLEKGEKFELHLFSDASKMAYSACAYVKTGNTVSLVASRARVTPIRAITIPRLELMAATIATRLAKKICDTLDLDMKHVTFWSDSKIVLQQLRHPAKEFKVFVSNRVGEIQMMTNPNQWRHVDTLNNVADLPTRGRTVRELSQDHVWWTGPDFLKLSEDRWPARLIDAEQQIKSKEELETHAVEVKAKSDFALDPERWSKLSGLIRRTAYVIRFIDRCKKDVRRFEGKHLLPDELNKAEKRMVLLCQQDAFREEIEMLRKGGPISRKSVILKLNPYLDQDGLIRSKSRLQFITWLEHEFRFPLILPKSHAFTKLIVKDKHEKIGHPVGTNATLNELQKKYWIVGIKVILKRVIYECMRCKIARARISQPAMGPLPPTRLSKPLGVFNVTSIDFAGPFFTKRGRGLSKNKRYLALFVCHQVRAVHLELVTSLETNSFLNALSRFIDRRGCPNKIISDNGKTFIRAEKEIKSRILEDQEKILDYNRQISWDFLPPYASNFGGVHEIFVKSMKRALYQVLGEASVTDEELSTAFVQVESFLNSRPLTQASDEAANEPCLTPNHFLIGRINPGNVLQSGMEESGLHPSRRWRYVQTLTQHAWNRWMSELLHSYRTRTKWKSDCKNLCIGDVVLVLDPVNLRKHGWRLGRVTKVFPGKDGIVRVVNVKVGDREYKRPTNKLCPLISFESQ